MFVEISTHFYPCYMVGLGKYFGNTIGVGCSPKRLAGGQGCVLHRK
jgi:hypothetical protein